jgi:hypothetical protein
MSCSSRLISVIKATLPAVGGGVWVDGGDDAVWLWSVAVQSYVDVGVMFGLVNRTSFLQRLVKMLNSSQRSTGSAPRQLTAAIVASPNTPGLSSMDYTHEKS